MKRMWGVLGAGLILGCLSCSWFSGPSKPEIIVPFEKMPVEKPMISNPQWEPDGDYIYFMCWNFSDEPQAICRTDPEGSVVEVVKRVEGSSLLCEVAPVGNKMIYWETEAVGDPIVYSCDILVIVDLEGNILDTIHTYTYDVYARFSKVTDTLLYVAFPYEGLRRYNLNTGGYELVLEHPLNVRGFPLDFDLFPGDTAVVVMDTIFSLTDGTQRALPIKDYSTYSECNICEANPRYVAFTGCRLIDYDENLSGKIIILDILADTVMILQAAPKGSKNFEYTSISHPDFSPDGNSLVYLAFKYGSGWDGDEIALITNVLGE